ncbi:MAG: DUF2586 family protein [Lentimicrobiaceae bacterium]|nr:DUF2586 family protein [Lentimicrobiaceae bacterium]
MGLPNVYIIVNRSGLGQVAFTNDGIMGILLVGSGVSGKLVLNTPYSIFSLADAEKLGIEKTGSNAHAWKQIKEFYDDGGSGKKLWILLHNEELMSESVDGTQSVAHKLIDGANGEIAVLGVTRGNSPSNEIVDGLNEDVIPTIIAAQLLANEYQKKIMPFSCVIDGLGYDGDADVVPDLKQRNDHRCSVVLSASANDGVASVGQLLGRLASVPVQRKASRIKDGALTNLEGFLTDGSKVDKELVGDLGTLHDKGYIVYRTIPGRTGFFYSGDPSATLPTDDLNTISRNRIIDKVLKIAYNVYVEELDDDVPMTASGNIEAAVCGYLKNKIENQVNGNMADEISSFSAFIDPEQNLLSGAPLEISLSIVPMAYLSEIKVTIGFVNPLLTT